MHRFFCGGMESQTLASWGLEKCFGCHLSITCTLNEVRIDLAGVKIDTWPIVEATSLSTCLSVGKI